MTPSRPRSLALFIDHIDAERAMARLIEREQSGACVVHSFPAALLPKGAREGQWIELQVALSDPPPGQDPAALRRRLGEGDDGGDIKL